MIFQVSVKWIFDSARIITSCCYYFFYDFYFFFLFFSKPNIFFYRRLLLCIFLPSINTEVPRSFSITFSIKTLSNLLPSFLFGLKKKPFRPGGMFLRIYLNYFYVKFYFGLQLAFFASFLTCLPSYYEKDPLA